MRSLISGWILLVGLCFGSMVWAEDRTIEDFYGQYIGHSAGTAANHRDISVTIGPTRKKGGFFVSWTTVSRKSGKQASKMKRKVYDIKFRPTQRSGIFSSAMKTNVFGGQTTLDPLQGEPFVWARIKGDTLTVHTLTITVEGDYEMQIYNRTLNDQGLLLEYSRLRSGEQLKQITAPLVRVAD